MDFAGIFSAFGTWFSSGLAWLIFAVFLTVGTAILLVHLKRTKLKYNCLELVSFGNGKVGMNTMKAGVFKKKTMLFGLIDVGKESVFKTSDNRIIQEANTDDLHDIKVGKSARKGFIVRRKDDDGKILVPISKVSWQNEKAIFEIAPADFRDASINIVEGATKETQGWADKYLPYIMLGGMIIFFIVGFILASQFFNRTVDKAGEILLQAGKNAGNVAGGSSP